MDGLGPLIVPMPEFPSNITMNNSFAGSDVLFFGVPFVATSGLLLNTMVLLVTIRCQIVNKICVPLVTLLCVSDGGFLLVLLLTWTGNNYVNIYTLSGVCQIAVFTSHMFGFMSSWIVVSLTTMTLVSLVSPEKFTRHCTPTASRFLVSVFGVFIFAAYLYKTWTHGTTETIKGPFCSVIPENKSAMKILSTIDVVLSMIVPCVVVFVVQICVLFFVLTGTNRKGNTENTDNVVVQDNRLANDQNGETSFVTGFDTVGEDTIDCNSASGSAEDVSNAEELNVTDIFMEPLKSPRTSWRGESSFTSDNWSERKTRRTSQTTRLSVTNTDSTLSGWKKALTFSVTFMCLVLPGAVENIAFMVQNDNVLSNLKIKSSSSHQFFQLMYYCHFALDGSLYVALTGALWEALRKWFK